jgi:anti-anti-sigma factor
MALASLHTEDRGESLLASVDGELDLSNVPSITRELAGSVPNAALRLVLDLTDVSYLDSAGIGMLYALGRQLRDRQQQFVLVVPSNAPIRRVLDVASVSSIAEIYDDQAGALSA